MQTSPRILSAVWLLVFLSLVAFAAEAIQGLMHSVEGVYSRKAVQP